MNILHVDAHFLLSNDDGKAGQLMQPITLYLTITVSANIAIALSRADEAMKPIDRSNTWEMVVGRVKWMMDTLSPIAEVHVMSSYLSFTEPAFTLSFPRMRRWHAVCF